MGTGKDWPVIHNQVRVLPISAEALVGVVADYHKYKEHAKPQERGESFTTPNFLAVYPNGKTTQKASSDLQ